MTYPKYAGMNGKMDQKKMRKQPRQMTRQGSSKVSDLPQTVSEEGEYDDEPGGVRLNGSLLTTNSDKPQGKAASELNPTSSPWLPKIHGINIKIHDSIAQTQSLPGSNDDAHSTSDTASDDQVNPEMAGQVCSPSLVDLHTQGAVYETGHIMSGLQFAPGHWAAPQQVIAGTNVNNDSHLTGSASMGTLSFHTPVRPNNSNGNQSSLGSTSTIFRAGVPSPGDSDTPKASNPSMMTEPRNFAPRTAGNLAHLGAPPKFNLNSIVNNKATTAVSQDPFVAHALQGGLVQPLFGSPVETTQLRDQLSFGPVTGNALNLDELPCDDQSGNALGAKTQSDINNGGPGQKLHDILTQHTTGNAAGALAVHQGTFQDYATQGDVVSYQAGYPTQVAMPQVDIAPYIAPAPDYIRAQRSQELNRLTATITGLPTVEAAMHHVNFPFIEPANRPGNFTVRGVVKIGNIPFVTNRSEIIAVLGRNSRILNDTEEPVHIIMERVTGKTTDAYVEFQTLEDAAKAVEKHQQNLSRGRVTRIGQRPVEIELSSQAALMKDLFPSARGVFWNGTNPQVLPNNIREPWENFKGFVSNEEMTMLVKHVEVPHRSPFSKECPQRPFECLISTLTKFPWHMKTYITVQQRHAMHKATCDLIRILVGSTRDHRDELNLTQRLLKRVVAAAMRCEGFSATQKDDIAYLVNMGEMEQRAFGQPRFAESWRHLYVLVPKTGVPLDVIEWYIAVIREETNRYLETQPFQERCQTRAIGDATDLYFGYFWRELNHPIGPAFDSMTLSQLAMHEYQTMESIIRRALTPADVHMRRALPAAVVH